MKILKISVKSIEMNYIISYISMRYLLKGHYKKVVS